MSASTVLGLGMDHTRTEYTTLSVPTDRQHQKQGVEITLSVKRVPLLQKLIWLGNIYFPIYIDKLSKSDEAK